MQRSLGWLLLLAAAPTWSADSARIAVEDLGHDRYRVDVTLPGVTDPAVAQRALLPAAEKLCGGRHPGFGRFTFDAFEPMKADGAPGSTSIRLKQEIQCGGTEPVVAASAPRAAPTAHDEAWIRTHTAEYLAARDAGDLDKAESMLSAETRRMHKDADARGDRESFRRAAGAAVESRLLGLDWNDDPPGVPPGRYVAIDYVIHYTSGATSCGYLAWHEVTPVDYEIVRTEEGLLSAQELARIAPADLPGFRRKMGCRD